MPEREVATSQRARAGARDRDADRRGDVWIALTALVAAMLALPLAHDRWHGPEVASVLAVSATALLARQRWALALIVIAEVLLAPTCVTRAFAGTTDVTAGTSGVVATMALVPGVLAIRRAAGALARLCGWDAARAATRRYHAGLIAAGLIAGSLPLF